MDDIKELILATTSDLVDSFLYYDRRDDEDLPIGTIGSAIRDGVITIDEIVAHFKETLEESLDDE